MKRPYEKRLTEKYNSLPFETRAIASDITTFARIRDLERLKKRVVANCHREMKFINDQIKIHINSIGK